MPGKRVLGVDVPQVEAITRLHPQGIARRIRPADVLRRLRGVRRRRTFRRDSRLASGLAGHLAGRLTGRRVRGRRQSGRIDFLGENPGVVVGFGGDQIDRVVVVEQHLEANRVALIRSILVVVDDLKNHPFARFDANQFLANRLDRSPLRPQEVVRDGTDPRVVIGRGETPGQQLTARGVRLSNLVGICRRHRIAARDFEDVIGRERQDVGLGRHVQVAGAPCRSPRHD